jgi:methylated-DNA-[protein]-cysteine S-methyltransferase
LRNKPVITDFQKAVYKAVLNIPYGQVRSYKWVAQKIGNKNAARAVGQVLKKNPFVGIVPCHRVIASDGSLGGFSRGIRKKMEMLKKEKVRIKPR